MSHYGPQAGGGDHSESSRFRGGRGAAPAHGSSIYGPSSAGGAAFPPRGPPAGAVPPFRPPFMANGPPYGGPPAAGGMPFRPPFQPGAGPPQIMGPPRGMMPLSVPGAFPPRPVVAMPSPTTPLPAGWSEHFTPQGAKYFYNANTGVSSYDPPGMAGSGASAVSAAAATPAVAESPLASAWSEYKDDASGKFYYYNAITKATVWEQPEEFRMQKAREEVAKMTHESSAEVVVEDESAAQRDAEHEQKQKEIEHKKAARKKKEEAENASKFREMPHDERVAAFKQFLEDKHVAPQLKWQDAQRHIVRDGLDGDPRWKFALSTVGEKKQAFAEYCTQAINKQNIEKRWQVKKSREDFVELLGLFESSLYPLTGSSKRKSSGAVDWEQVADGSAFFPMRKDPRWSAIEDVKVKQQLFEGFMLDLARNQKQRHTKLREDLKAAFLALLRQRIEAKQIEFHSSKRLDSDEKKQVLSLLYDDVEIPDGKKDVAVSTVDKYEVYDWTEDLLKELRDEEHARHKEERAKRKELEIELIQRIRERCKTLVDENVITASTTWDDVADRLTESAVQEKLGSDVAVSDAAAVGAPVLKEKTRRRIFEKVVKDMRRQLQPAATAVASYLKRADPPLTVSEATTYEVFTNALESGIRTVLDGKTLEEGEEVPSDTEMTDVVKDSDENRSAETETAATAALLERLVQERGQENPAASNADADVPKELFPPLVRDVFGLLVATVKERKEKQLTRERYNGKNQSSEKESSRRGRKRRRRDSSMSERSAGGGRSVSRSRSRSRSRSVHRRLSRSHSPSRSRSRGRGNTDGHQAPWYQHKSEAGSTEKTTPSMATITAGAPMEVEDPTSAAKQPPTALSAEEEAAKAEEIIRVARLRLLEKQKRGDESDDSELEEGEEVEDSGATESE